MNCNVKEATDLFQLSKTIPSMNYGALMICLCFSFGFNNSSTTKFIYWGITVDYELGKDGQETPIAGSKWLGLLNND
jgi:hypothetical protein